MSPEPLAAESQPAVAVDVPREGRGRVRTASLLPALLIGLAVLPLLPTLRAGFIYDDTIIIRDNALLRGWSALARVWESGYWPGRDGAIEGLYRPVHVALLALVWNVGGGAAGAFHVYALALYAAVVVLVWRLMRRAVGGVAAAVGTAWFATHALHVEAVASVANTAELLVTGCAIALAILLARAPQAQQSLMREWMRALLAALLVGVAILSKESGLLVLPLAALTAWGWNRGATVPNGREFVRRHGRSWLAGAAALTAALLLRASVIGTTPAPASLAAPGLDALSAPERVLTMLSLWPRIAGMIAWPTALSPYYGPTVVPGDRAPLAAIAVLLVATLAALALALARRGDRRLLVALGWAALTYLPASNLVAATGPFIADRILLGATVGAALAIGLVADRVRPSARRILVLVFVALTVRNAVESFHYASVWTSHRSLWERLVETSPGEYRGYQLAGIDARERGDTARALPLLARAFAMEPRDRRVRFEYGQVLYVTGRYEVAARTLAPLLRDEDVRRERGFVAMYLDAVGRARGPRGVVDAGTPLLRSEASSVAALYVGIAKEQLGEHAGADSVYRAGLRAVPGDSLLLARLERLERARRP